MRLHLLVAQHHVHADIAGQDQHRQQEAHRKKGHHPQQQQRQAGGAHMDARPQAALEEEEVGVLVEVADRHRPPGEQGKGDQRLGQADQDFGLGVNVGGEWQHERNPKKGVKRWKNKVKSPEKAEARAYLVWMPRRRILSSSGEGALAMATRGCT